MGVSPQIPIKTKANETIGWAFIELETTPRMPPGILAAMIETITIAHSPIDSESRVNGHSTTLLARLAAMVKTAIPHMQMVPRIGLE